MKDVIVTGLSVLALIVVSVGVGELALAGHHQVYVTGAAAK